MKNLFLSIYLCITAMLLIFALSLIRLEYLRVITPDPLVGADCTKIYVQNDYDSTPLSLDDLECFFDFAQDTEFKLIYSSRYGKIILSNTAEIGLNIVEIYESQKLPIAAYVSTQTKNSLLGPGTPRSLNVGDAEVPVLAVFDKGNEMLDDHYLRFSLAVNHSDLSIPVEGELWLASKDDRKMAAQFKTKFDTNSISIQILPPSSFEQKFDALLKALDMHLYMFLVFILGAALLCMNSASVILFGIKRKRREITVRRVCGASDQALYWFFLIDYWISLSISYLAAIIISSILQHLHALDFLQLRVDPISVLIAFPFHLMLSSVIGLFSIHRALRKQIAQVLR